MSRLTSAFVARVSQVRPHPDSDKLDIVTVAGFQNVANRPQPDTPRYAVGDYAVVLMEGLILPDELIKHLDMWNHEKNRGGMAGSKGNRTKGRNVAGVMSEVALCRAEWRRSEDRSSPEDPSLILQSGLLNIEVGGELKVSHMMMNICDTTKPDSHEISPEGFDVTAQLGIVVHVPATA